MHANLPRLAQLSLPAKLLITLFLLIIGPGYLFGVTNIMLKHQDADLEPGLSLNDLRRTFHGLEKEVTPKAEVTVNSTMLTQVRPGGDMREHLEPGGEPAIRGLITWLEAEAKEADFARSGMAEAGDPSAQEVLAAHCIECHNADGGDMEDVPFAAAADAEPEYALVFKVAEPTVERHQEGPRMVMLEPTNAKRLVHVTHMHIMAVPVFTLLVGGLFLLTGLGNRIKLILTPLPMLAVGLDIYGWWIARAVEPSIYVIAAAGGLFTAVYALQILCILGSMWLGRAAD